MDHNFTPLNVPKIMQKKEAPVRISSGAFESKFNTILLLLFTLTLLILSIVIFILIQKKIQKTAYYQSTNRTTHV